MCTQYKIKGNGHITNKFCHSHYLISHMTKYHFSFGHICNQSIFVMFLKSPKYFGPFFHHHFSHNFNFVHHQIPIPFLYHQDHCSSWTKGGQKTTKSPILPTSPRLCGQKTNHQNVQKRTTNKLR